MKPKTYLNLTGGLGNQFFQLASALYLSNGSDVVIEVRNGKPRSTTEGLPDITSFTLPSRVSICQKNKFSWLASKATGFTLRSGVSPRRYEQLKIFRKVFVLAASLINSISIRYPMLLKVNSGVGYDANLKSSKFQMLVGYFQTFHYATNPSVQNELQNLKPAVLVDEIEQYRELARTEMPLVVHVRLGDYKLEDSFGILSQNYYENSIDELWSSGDYKKIWLFSDEPENAIKLINNKLLKEVRTVSEISNSAAYTLEVMRLGHGYVIANSSFSWWAAFLSYSHQPRVIAPKPWFVGQLEPIDLIPDTWLRRNGHL